MCALASRASAQESASTNEFWPQANVFLTLNPNVRLIFEARKELDTEFRNAAVGGDIEFSIRRFQTRRNLPWEDRDATRKTRISFLAGYKYKRSFDSEPPVHENRPDLECTVRWALHREIIVGNRARWEFRFVSGSPFSWRYRHQLELEGDVKVKGYTFSPYIAAEPFYNSHGSRWDRFRFSGGAVFPVSKRFGIEAYYLRQIVTDSQPRFTNAIGLAIQVHQPVRR